MFVQLISSVAIAIIGSFGLLNFLNDREKEEESSLFVKSTLAAVVIAAVLIVVTKLVYGTEKIKSEPVAKKDQKKKSKSKLKDKKELKLAKEKTCAVVKKIEPSTINEEQKKLKKDKRIILNSKYSVLSEDVDQDLFVSYEKSISIVKKVRKKDKQLKQNKIADPAVEEKVDSNDKYLKQGARPKTNATRHVSYDQDGSKGLVSSEKRDVTSFKSEENASPIFITMKLSFESSVRSSEPDSYEEDIINFCEKLKEFRKLHLSYCCNLANKIFKVKDNELIVNSSINALFAKFTTHTEVLFPMLKVFLLMNFSSICGGSKLIDSIRNCSKYFYEQSLMNLLLSKIMMTSSKVEISKIKEILQDDYSHLADVPSYSPHSKEFFQLVFDICRHLASVKQYESEVEEELINFAMLACFVHCGNMLSSLFKNLSDTYNDKVGYQAYSCLSARSFCRLCHSLRTLIIYMYHPDEGEVPLNVGGVIDVPSKMWKSCPRRVNCDVKDSFEKNKLTFGVFIQNLICGIRKLILLPSTRSHYKNDINLYDQCLNHGVNLKGIVTSCVGYNQKGSVGLASSRKRDVPSFKPEESSGAISISTGLYFESSIKYGKSSLYKPVVVDFCKKLREFRRLHLSYCFKLGHQIFKIRDNELVVNPSVNALFAKFTAHTEVLYFIFKVFLLMNFSSMCGGRIAIDNIRYCSRHFYNQSLVDLLLSKIMMTTSHGRGGKIKGILEDDYSHLLNLRSYSPHSKEFFQMIFNICHDLALVEQCESELEKELIDFGILTCLVYCGHMVANLFKTLSDRYNEETGGTLHRCLSARNFCRMCHDLRGMMVHMYHPDKGEVPLSVGDVIEVPPPLWKNCSKRINCAVRDSFKQGKLTFGVFVNDIVSHVRKMILLPETRSYYQNDINLYDYNIRKVTTLSLLPNKRFVYDRNETNSL